MRVRDFMVVPVVTTRRESTLEQAAKIMLEKDIGALPVVDEKGESLGNRYEIGLCRQRERHPFLFISFCTAFWRVEAEARR